MKTRSHWQLTTFFVIIIGIASLTLSRTNGIFSLVVIAGMYAVTSLVARQAKLTKTELGLDRKYLSLGLLKVLPFIFAIFMIAWTVFLIDPGLFKDQRYNQGINSMLLMIFVSIPIKTVILEEFMFRGVLLGLFNRKLTQTTTVLTSALVFGLWHVFSAGAVNFTQQASLASSNWSSLAVISVVFVTFVSGIFFAWLRVNCKSLIAPMLTHWAVNSVGVVLAFLAWNT